jgi:hypothetical protein
MDSPDSAVMLASLLYPYLTLGDFGRLCLTCSALQAFARRHKEFQEATLNYRILGLMRQLDQQTHKYTQEESTMEINLKSHCLTLLLCNPQKDKPWRCEDLDRLIFIYEKIFRRGTMSEFTTTVLFKTQDDAVAQSLNVRYRLFIENLMPAKLWQIRLSWSKRNESLFTVLRSNSAFEDFKNMM